MVFFKLIDRSFGFVSTMVLAHLLVPADFGIVAMATSLSALLELLTYFGLDMALLRQRETTEDHFNAVWTLNVLCGCAMAALMIALAIPAAHFYREPRVTAVICALAGVPLIQAFENVGVVNFRKEMRFDREFRFMFYKRVVRFTAHLAGRRMVARLLGTRHWHAGRTHRGRCFQLSHAALSPAVLAPRARRPHALLQVADAP